MQPRNDSHSLVKNGKTLLSGIDPAGRAEKIVDALSLKNRTLYLCPSPLYGFGLSRLLFRFETEAPGSAALCVEADSELYELSAANIESSVAKNKKFHLTDVCDAEKLPAVIRGKWGVMAFRRIEMIRLNGGWQLFSQAYDLIRDQLCADIALQWSNALTLNKLGRLYMRNLLRNLPLLSRFQSADVLSFGSYPLLVLGAGPSLDDVLKKLTEDNLQRTERKFKIICVDTCLGALKDRGIIPDLTVILESQHWNLRDFIGCRDWNVNAAVDLSSLPASAQILSGGVFLFMTPWTNLRIFERLEKAELLPAAVAPLGSVGLTAVELARRLTSGKIICAGLDFSFSQDKYHARSTPGHRGKLNAQNRFRTILNTAAYDSYSSSAVSKSGENVRTSPSMKNYRGLFESEFGGDPRVFDIEGIGLPLGVKTLSMEEAFNVLKNEELGIRNEELEMRNEELGIKNGEKKIQLTSFFKSEVNRLVELRDILTGGGNAGKESLSVLLDECDYLWAHFPDYSGGRSADISDISFLKRVRAEIDPVLKLLTV